jgi:hypothetical protein
MSSPRAGRFGNVSGSLAAEFLVIVVGVLVALAVDDVRDWRNERQLEAHLLERLEEDLVADAADLAIAEFVLERRAWILSELDAGLRDGRPARPIPPGTLLTNERIVLLDAAGRPEVGLRTDSTWYRVDLNPLWKLESTPDFDQSDDAYQEMIVGGTLRTLRDLELRSSILAYYRTSRDMADNVMGADGYMAEWTSMLLDTGFAQGDPVTLDQLVEVVRSRPRMAVQVRHALATVATQEEFLGRIGVALRDLRTRLAADG